MFWLRNKKNNFLLRTLIWGPVIAIILFHCASSLIDIMMCKGSYMRAHVLLNLLDSSGKSDKILGKPRILSLFLNLFNKFIYYNT